MKDISKEELTKIIAGAAFGGLFLYGYFAYFWMPYSKKIDENKVKIEKIDKDIAAALKAKNEFKNLEQKLKDLELQKIEAEKKLPKEKKVPDLLKTVKRLSDKHSVKIMSIAPGNSSKDQYFTKVNYSMTVTGRYHDVGKFFTAVALEERILSMENAVISQLSRDNASCSVNFILSAYQFEK